MSPLAISGIVFACVFGGTLLGMILRAVLPEQHLEQRVQGRGQAGHGPHRDHDGAGARTDDCIGKGFI